LDYTDKTVSVLKQVADRNKTTNEKNVSTALDNTSHDIQEAGDDNGCDDTEEDDDNEDEEHGEGDTPSGMEGKRRQECSFYFTTEPVKRIHSKGVGIVTVIYRVLHVDLQYLIPCKAYRLSTNC